MRRNIVVIALAVLAGIVVAGCTGNSNNHPTPSSTVVTNPPTTTTTVDDTASYLASTCASTGSQLVDVANQYISTLSDNVYVVVTEPSVRAAAIDTGQTLSSGLRQWAATCRSYSPSAASAATSLASSVDDLVNTLSS